MKIAIYGASVSAQSVRHDNGAPVGYSEFLRQEHMDRLGADAITQFTYAGNRLADGGVVRLAEVLEYKPDICIVEPVVEDVSRGLSAGNDDLLFVYDSLIRNGIIPVTLLLPWPLTNRDLRIYKISKDICKKLGLPIIEFELPVDFNVIGNFVGVHTLASSGKMYADEIAKVLAELGSIDYLIKQIKEKWVSPEKMLYISKKIMPSHGSFTKLSIRVKFEREGNNEFRLLQKQEIGPFSPMFSVDIIDEFRSHIGESKISSAWDPYCHYTRSSYVLLVSDMVSAQSFRLLINKIGRKPAYSLCRRSDVSWPPISDLQFRPSGSLYLVGNSRAEIELMEYV